MPSRASGRCAARLLRSPRRAEGRGAARRSCSRLPYLATGPQARAVGRARTYDAFVAVCSRRCRGGGAAAARPRPGRGERLALLPRGRRGHRPTALDVRDDAWTGWARPGSHSSAAGVDASSPPSMRCRCPAEPSTSPCSTRRCTTRSTSAPRCARRARGPRPAAHRHPRLALLPPRGDGEAMVAEKRATPRQRFGDRADVAGGAAVHRIPDARAAGRAPPAGPRLAPAPRALSARGTNSGRSIAVLRGGARPSRFDLWGARVP